MLIHFFQVKNVFIYTFYAYKMQLITFFTMNFVFLDFYDKVFFKTIFKNISFRVENALNGIDFP